MISEVRKRSRWVQLFWATLLFGIVFTLVWRGYDPARYDWLYILSLCFVLALNGFYGEGFRKLGFRPRNFKKPFLEYGKKLAGLFVLILLLGFLFGTARYSDPFAMISGFGKGLLWGLFQQYLLNGFFVNRLAGFFENDKDPRISWIGGGLFALVHLPNWFLMAVTFFGGWVCTKIFLKYENDRNLYFLGLAHALVSFSFYIFTPDSISNHFIVGYRYFQ